MARFHGLPHVFDPDRIKTTLDTVKRTCIASTKYGALSYTNPDGSLVKAGLSAIGSDATYGAWALGFPPHLIILAMNYIYEGEVDVGIELARRNWDNIVLRQGRAWDAPNMLRGDTGEVTYGSDYYQNLMLWALPIAIQGRDLRTACAPGGLVERVITASK